MEPKAGPNRRWTSLPPSSSRCPPEDCGGVWGYADLLGLTRKKKLTAEERENLEWYQMDEESEFDPEYCDIEFFKEIAEDYNDTLQDYLES